MILWRLAGQQHAGAFDRDYGFLYDGRWNTVGHAVTYCATSPFRSRRSRSRASYYVPGRAADVRSSALVDTVRARRV
jgi:RES domain-containing protein